MGIFGSFKRANEVIEQAKKDVKRPRKDEVAAKRGPGRTTGPSDENQG